MTEKLILNLDNDAVMKRAGRVILGWIDAGAVPKDPRAELEAAGILFNDAGGAVKVNVHSMAGKNLQIMLPTKDMIAEIHNYIETENRYNLPSTVIDFVRNEPLRYPTPDKKKDPFYVLRLADYILNHCGGD